MKQLLSALRLIDKIEINGNIANRVSETWHKFFNLAGFTRRLPDAKFPRKPLVRISSRFGINPIYCDIRRHEQLCVSVLPIGF